MMLTWELWHELRHPAWRHPLFQSIQRRDRNLQRLIAGWGMAGLWLILVLIYIRMWSGRGISTIFVSLFFASLTLAFLIALFGRLGRGVPLAMEIATTVVALHQSQRYDLLCLLPDGELQSNWLIASGCLYGRMGYSRLSHLPRRGWMMRWAMVIVTGLILSLLTALTSEPGWMILFMIMMAGWALVIFLHLDDVQGTISACLIGILVATYVRSRNDARLWAAALVTILQVMLYTLIVLLAFLLLQVYIALEFSDTLIALTLPILAILLLFLLRNILIVALHSRVRARLVVS